MFYNALSKISQFNLDNFYEDLKIISESRKNVHHDHLGSSFTFLVSLNIFYILSVKFGILYMKDKQAFNIDRYQTFYNISCIVLNAYLVYAFFDACIIKNGFWFVCNNSYPNSIYLENVMNAVYLFYLSKFWEYQDTWIMILRKNNHQVSFLHRYHHISITLVVWAYLNYCNGGDEILSAFLNSLIHVFMYGHYLLSTYKIKSWWKPYLTQMQLLQFCFIFIQGLTALSIDNCGFPDTFKVLQMLYMITMLILFMNFYLKNY